MPGVYNPSKSQYPYIVGPDGQHIPDINAILASMVSRDQWTYYYTLKLDAGTNITTNPYALFDQAVNKPDPYPVAGLNANLTKVETNMPAACSNGFPPPRDLIMDQLGFYFRASGVGTANNAIGTNANVADMMAFCQYSYFEFKIIEKVFIEGLLDFNPSGVGFTGVATQNQQQVYSLGMVNPHAVNRLRADYAKYLAPQMQWSVNIYFPPLAGPGGAAPTLLTANQGGHGLWLVSFVKGLTSRAIQ